MKAIVTCVVCLTLLSINLKAQNAPDTSIHRAAIAICGCLTKSNIDQAKNQNDLQQIFLKCMLDSATGTLTNIIANNPDMTQEEAGEEIGKKIAMEMMTTGCPAFIKLSMKLAGGNMGDDNAAADAEVKSTDGVVIKVEEKDFLYITVKNSSGKLVTVIFMSDVDGSAEWMKEPIAKLLNKKVTVQWTEEEAYQPKLKDFANIKQLKGLTFK